MTERELLEKIKSSAEEIEVPESLSPESIKKRLDAAVQAGEHSSDTKKEEKVESTVTELVTSGKQHWSKGRKMVAAAAVLLLCGTGTMATYQFLGGAATGADGSAGDREVAEMAEESVESGALATEESSASQVEKSDAGEMYVVAEGYGELYDLLKEQKETTWISRYDGAILEGAVEEAGEAEDSATTTGTADMAASSMQSQKQELSEGAREYSKTNLQTAGVDESDIIKTDGNYIYVVNDNTVKMIDIRKTKMSEAGEIPVALGSAADRVVEMYVDGDMLNLIVEKEQTDLKARKKTTSLGTTEDIAICDAYYVNTNVKTELLTYDISDRKNPVLKGSTSQDGCYKTSRKVGDIVYLFTEKYLELPDMAKRQATKEEAVADWIPLVNETPIAADCIYLPERGEYGLIISSVDVENPDTVVDNTLIMNDYVNIYVSRSAIYLYSADYSGSGVSTQIAKFGFHDGIINAVGATSAKGDVYDTFAINEYQGKLRLLTTDWSGEKEENQLYLFDENLKLIGSLTGLAEGEQIYAARYFGDTVYFVTYRNTDPLFAVDLSDEKNPKILSELKITGFSEYLHFWGPDKLVGIGYETDPKTGERKGIKLSMFDISDPANLTTLGTCVIDNLDYSPALYDYKCVLADVGENMIGFAVESYDRGTESSYLILSWEDGKFQSLLSEKIEGNELLDEYRGIYAGDVFYLVNTEEITSYDRKEEYKEIQTLKW